MVLTFASMCSKLAYCCSSVDCGSGRCAVGKERSLVYGYKSAWRRSIRQGEVGIGNYSCLVLADIMSWIDI